MGLDTSVLSMFQTIGCGSGQRSERRRRYGTISTLALRPQHRASAVSTVPAVRSPIDSLAALQSRIPGCMIRQRHRLRVGVQRAIEAARHGKLTAHELSAEA